jgi:glycosyltransferase involved in cell wall biosynthesis
MIKISVVIACLNEVHTLGEQLDALSRQQWHDWEVIIADNGSTDGTQELARSFADRLNITVLDASDEPGSGYARNEGARAASGDALLFPDADDVVADDWLAHMGQAL